MEKFEFRPASRVHCTQLAPRLRASDLLEIYRASGMDPLDALVSSVNASDEDLCWTAFLRGHPVAIFGANDITPEDSPEPHTVGGIWLLASPGIYENKLDFHRSAVKFLAKMHERYEYLTNFIDVDNIPTQAWLPRLGFKVAAYIPKFGFTQEPFVQYISRRS